MQWHELIFSEDRKLKTVRHVVFWTAWWLYFLLCYYLLNQPLPKGKIQPGYLKIDHLIPLKTLLLLILYAIACYWMIYILLPYLIKNKWLNVIGHSILILSFVLISSHFLYWNLLPLIDSASGFTKPTPAVAWFWPAINLGLMNFAKVASTAAIIKCTKYWWLKQQEIQRLEKDRMSAELQLLKAQVHPDFLFNTLNNIHEHAVTSSPRTSVMLLKLSELLSYMLYECDQPAVPLAKEIDMMTEYMQLEKIRYNDEPELQVSIKGDLDAKSIAPFLLVPFIENSFKHCGQMTEQSWINMDIRVDGDHFSMKLTNGIPDKITEPALANGTDFSNVQKRLTLLYPGKHELKITAEQEMSIVLLNIRFDAVTDAEFNVQETTLPTAKHESAITTALKYATK
jgi:two-component system LytT family sensor kinase